MCVVVPNVMANNSMHKHHTTGVPADVLHVLMYPTDNAVYQALWVNQLSVDKILRHPEVAQDIVNLHLLPASVDKHKMKEFFSQV